MELSPQQIRGVGFKMVKKGYDPDEVDAFKEDVATVVETVHSQATAMEARARAAVAKLHEVSQNPPAPASEREPEGFSASDNDRITRTLALAQRTADAAVAEARNADFDNVSIDLMYGLPNQSLATWRDTIERAVSLRPAAWISFQQS